MLAKFVAITLIAVSLAAMPSLIGSDYTEITYNFSEEEFSIQTVQTNGETFAVLSMKNAVHNISIGKPDLPIYRILVEIPVGARASVRVDNPIYDEINLADMGYSGYVYPVQPPVLKLPGYKAPFTMDGYFYQKDNWTNGKWATIEEREIEFELSYLLSLTIEKRFELMFRKSKEVIELLENNGHGLNHL